MSGGSWREEQSYEQVERQDNVTCRLLFDATAVRVVGHVTAKDGSLRNTRLGPREA